MNSSIPAKDVIYIDVDDEITTIIDKVRGSQSKIVALVLPKRATTLQSIVNMKLLKKSADTDKKHLVLITGEAGLLPLAAATELYVAKNLQTKPEIPTVADAELPKTFDDSEDAVSLDDEPLDRSVPVGDLASRGAGAGRVISPGADSADDDTIDMGSMGGEPHEPKTGPAVNGKKAKTPKAKKNKSLKVPNFGKFRMWLLLGGAGLVLLIILLIVCVKVLPKANILVKTNSQALSSNVDLVLNPSAKTLDESRGVVPAQAQQTQKTYTQSVAATGQQNNGQKASGSVKFYNCNQADTLSGEGRIVPAGAGISSNGLTFITTQSVTVPASHFKGNTCQRDLASDSVNVVAQSPGAKYNTGPATYSVAGSSSLSASGDSMNGGTDDIKKVVQQSDIDNAKSKIANQDAAAIKSQLQNQLNTTGYYPVNETFNTGTPNVSTNVGAGTVADSVTVTESVTYTMLGVHQADLQTLIAKSLKGQVDTSKQSILDYGLSDATFANVSASGTKTTTVMRVTPIVGPNLNIADLKKQVAGKKTGDATQIIKSNPGVTDVDISYSPFWVHSIPGNAGKITMTIDKPQVKKQ